MSNSRRVLIVIAILGVVALAVLKFRGSPGGVGEVVKPSAGGQAGNPSRQEETRVLSRIPRRERSANDEQVSAILGDESISNEEAGSKLLKVAIHEREEGREGLTALEHALSLLDDKGVAELLEWLKKSPPDRAVAALIDKDRSGRDSAQQMQLLQALMGSRDQAVRNESLTDLRFLLRLEPDATEAEVRLALAKEIAANKEDRE